MKTLTLECDNCSVWDDFGQTSASEIRKAAKKAGWTRDGKGREAKDLCPSCSPDNWVVNHQPASGIGVRPDDRMWDGKSFRNKVTGEVSDFPL